MTLDEAVALSLISDLSRVGLADRLRAGDPVLLERARALLDRARLERTRAETMGVHVLPWHDPRFPATLLAIPDMPPVLWYRGDLDALCAPTVAIVGSRAASAAALEIAARLGTDLAAMGITVVSGLARGVDSSAHRGALRAGRTVAVLGSGVDRIYPREHETLAGEIARTGLVVSEYPPGAPPLAFHFPMRNRLISGLSRAVVVVEANQKSGSLMEMASRKGTFWPREKGPPFLSCGGRRDVAGRCGATGGHVATSAIAVAPPVSRGTFGCVWRL